jgi:hypothetical protein
MNSSSAASMMAWRRSAARSARLEGDLDNGALGKIGFGDLAAATFSPRRRPAGLDAFLAGDAVREPDIDIL